MITAVGLTFGTLFGLLFAYKSGMIRATENFKLGVVAATGGIAVVYLVTMVLGFFGIRMPYIHESGMIGIGFSLFVVVIAALNLVLDFDFIEQRRGARARRSTWSGTAPSASWSRLSGSTSRSLSLLSKMRSRR